MTAVLNNDVLHKMVKQLRTAMQPIVGREKSREIRREDGRGKACSLASTLHAVPRWLTPVFTSFFTVYFTLFFTSLVVHGIRVITTRATGFPCSRMRPVTFPPASTWNSKTGPRGSWRRVSERALRGISAMVPGFTNSAVPSRRKVTTVPPGDFH